MHFLSFCFFFSQCMNGNITWIHCARDKIHWMHCSRTVHKSHGTIHTLKNYFAIVFSISAKISCIQTSFSWLHWFFFFWLNKRFEVKLSPISKTNWHLDSWSNNKSNHCIVDVIGLNSVISIKKENFYCVSYQQLDATYKDIIKLTDS